MIWTHVRRGLLAGLLAGFLAGLFGFAFGVPTLDRAVDLEDRVQRGEHSHEEEVFDRGEQKAGLFLATTLYGTAVGGIFGLVSACFRGRTSLRSAWVRSLALSGAIFTGAVFLPFLKYPPNPPGIGTAPETLAARTTAYLAMVVLSLLVLFFAWRLSWGIKSFAAPTRHLSVSGFLLVSWGLLLALMPDFGDVGEAPIDLVWEFRLSALGTQAVLWAGIGGVFGLLGEKAEAQEAVGSRDAATVAAGGGPR